VGRTDDLFGLEDFARSFLADISHFSEVRTEQLTEAFRRFFGLPDFPTLAQLLELCRRLGIGVAQLPPSLHGMNIDGMNIWHDGTPPTIYLHPEQQTRRVETTLGHELREVIEHAFQRAKPSYVGLDTRDNRTMNPEADHFAACLLMPADATRARMLECGFDLVRFAREQRRSLPSVILRAQQLFPAGGPCAGPVAGFWLFEAPWEAVVAGRARPSDLAVTHLAKLGGFSLRRKPAGRPQPARRAFPRRGDAADRFRLTALALRRGRPVAACLRGFDLFEERNYLAVAEPICVAGAPWRVVLIAVRLDTVGFVRPLLDRLGIDPEATFFQQL
jgi:hypothetical protein